MENIYVNTNKVSVDVICNFLENSKKQQVDLHSFIIYKNGELLARVGIHPYSPDQKRQYYSLSKSFTSTAIGFAVDEGLLTVDDFLADFFPEKLPENPSEYLKRMRVKDLLTMTCGHSACPYGKMINSSDWIKTFFETPVEFAPGTHYVYNTGASYMLSAIITKLTGESMFDYLTPRLFEPIGIEDIYWDSCPDGISQGGVGLHASCDDLAKFAVFYANKGMADGKQLLSREWIEEATSYQADNSNHGSTIDWQAGYGYHFWMNRPGNGYRGDGADGQLCYIDTDKNVAFTVLAESNNMQDEVYALVDCINELDSTAHTKTMADLEAMIAKINSAPKTSQGFEKKLYLMDKNIYDFTRLSLYQDENNSMILAVSDGDCIQKIVCGNGRWIQNRISARALKPAISMMRSKNKSNLNFFASYELEENCVNLKFCHIDNPHKQTLRCKLEGNSITVDIIAKDNHILDEGLQLKGTLIK